MPKQTFFVNEDELDDFQIQLLQKRIDRSMVVSGCAGSGKSILALWKAKQIQDLQDGSSYKFIVFTKTLNQYMSDGIREIGLDDGSFMHYAAWKKAGFPAADYLIVDEIQDFGKHQITRFRNAAQKALFFWGDTAQSIFSDLPRDSERGDIQTIREIANDVGIMPDQLYHNYRLPLKIARFAAPLTEDENLVLRCKKDGPDMPKPWILKSGPLQEQLDLVMQQITNRQITDAGILFPTNDEVKQAYEYLRGKGHAVEAKYDDRQNFKNSRMDLDFSNDNPKLITYHSAKGLQFEAVFLPECSVSYNDQRKPLYVAVTRSYRYLYIMYSTKLSRFFDVIPVDLYRDSLEEEEIRL